MHLPDPVSTHQLTTYDLRSRRKVITLAPGESGLIGVADGPGYLAKLWLTFPGWFWAHWEPDRPIDQRMLSSVVVEITVDGADAPQVRAPVADLVGIGLCRMANFAAGRLGASSGGFYLTFPMPFRSSLQLRVINTDPDHPTDVFCNALYQRVAELPADTPYFHAFHAAGRNPGPDPLVIADVEGSGRYVGCTLSCQGERRNNLSFLEAPEHFVIDDDDHDHPRIVGTGLEDYFLGGWYFREGTFAGPDHGVPIKDPLDSAVSMYRIHDADAVVFDRRFHASFRTPWDPDRVSPFAHSSVALFYLDRPTAAPQLPADRPPWYRIADTDHQSIP